MGLRAAFENAFPLQVEVYDGKVVAVDERKQLVDVEVAPEVTYFNIKLKALSDGTKKGIVLLPAMESKVVFCKIEGEADYVIIAASKVDKIIADIDTEISINAPHIIFNGGDNNGLVKVKALESNLKNIKEMVDAIHQALPNAFNAIGASNAANGALGKAAYEGATAGKSISIKAMDNDKIKH
jgi:hypothetical protein